MAWAAGSSRLWWRKQRWQWQWRFDPWERPRPWSALLRMPLSPWWDLPTQKNWPGIIHVPENPPGLRPQNILHGWQPPVAAPPRSVPLRPLRPRTKESRFRDLEHRRQALVGNQPGSLFYNRSGSWLPSLVYEERHQIIQWRGFGGLDSLESQ